MDRAQAYADYMLAWMERLELPHVPEFEPPMAAARKFWSGDRSVDLSKSSEFLWSWVWRNGGPGLGINPDKSMLMARMIICVSYPDNRELQEMGFFEDLLFHFGVSRNEINSYRQANLMQRT